MNKIVLIGRLIKDFVISPSDIPKNTKAETVIAVEIYDFEKSVRVFENFTIIMKGKQAEVASEYLNMGSMIAVSGRIRSRKIKYKGDEICYCNFIEVQEFDFIRERRMEHGEVIGIKDVEFPFLNYDES